MIDSYTFADYINEFYLTLLLASLVMLLIVNRDAKITGLRYIWLNIGIVFTLTLNTALERICDAYQWNYRNSVLQDCHILFPRMISLSSTMAHLVWTSSSSTATITAFWTMIPMRSRGISGNI